MIEAFVGLVGGGKTFGATRRMCEYVLRGGVVATNILFKGYDSSTSEFSPDSPFILYLASRGWKYQSGQYVYISYDDMTESADWFSRVPGGQSRSLRTLLCIDEATDLFDTLDRNKLNSDSVYRELFRFLRLSRHAHIDVLFICQDFFSINSRLRGLVGAIWKSTDMKNFRLPTFHIPLPFNCFLLQKFDRTGKLELYREFIAKDSRIFGIYESEAFHDALGITFAGVVGDGRIDGGKKMSGFQKIILFLALVLAVYCLIKLSRQSSRIDYLVQTIDKISFSSSNSENGSFSSPKIVEDKQSINNSPPLIQASGDEFLRGDYEYRHYGSYPVLYFNGDLIKVGMITEYGKCLRITEDFALCVGDGRVYLLPRRRSAGPPKTAAFVPSDDDGDGRAL